MAIALSTMLWGGTLRAGEKEVFEPGTGKYILVLVNPNTDTADPKTKKKPKEPDVAKHGGKLLYKLKECRVIKLPLAAAKALRKEENVAFLQRVWLGESLEGWEESEVPSTESFLKAPVESDATDLTWTTGTYTYDGSGNIKAIGGDTYRYDTAGRLSQTTFHGVVETYKYDSFGNLTERAPAGQPNIIRVESSSNRLTGESYDAAGNVTTRGLKDAYSYDSLNQMDQIVTPLNADRRMIYGPDEERIGVIVDTQLARWKIRDFDGRVLREFKDMGSDVWQWEEDYVYEEGRLVGGDRDPYFGGARHFHTDHLGSVRMITDHEGMRIGVHDYYPFGQEQTSVIQNWTLSPELREEAAKFTGHERDYNGLLNWENTDYIDYMHARYYDPGVGRFLSIDPTLDSADLGKPQSWNRYAYVLNNPVNVTDPDGKCPFCVQVLVELAEDFITDGSPTGSSADLPKDPGERAAYIKAATGTVGVVAYQVGTVDKLRAASSPGDKIDVHHAPQAKPAGQVITKYDPAKAPGIALQQAEHKAIPTQKGTYTGTARDLLAKDVRDLRKHTDAPNSALKKLVKLVKETFPDVMKKIF